MLIDHPLCAESEKGPWIQKEFEPVTHKKVKCPRGEHHCPDHAPLSPPLSRAKISSLFVHSNTFVETSESSSQSLQQLFLRPYLPTEQLPLRSQKSPNPQPRPLPGKAVARNRIPSRRRPRIRKGPFVGASMCMCFGTTDAMYICHNHDKRQSHRVRTSSNAQDIMYALAYT